MLVLIDHIDCGLLSFPDNYVLKAGAGGNYGLVSAVQQERGAKLLYPHFGFSYRAMKARLMVIFVETASNTQHTMLNMDLTTSVEDRWRYWSKNISTVDFITTAWSNYANTPTPLLWRVSSTK